MTRARMGVERFFLTGAAGRVTSIEVLAAGGAHDSRQTDWEKICR